MLPFSARASAEPVASPHECWRIRSHIAIMSWVLVAKIMTMLTILWLVPIWKKPIQLKLKYNSNFFPIPWEDSIISKEDPLRNYHPLVLPPIPGSGSGETVKCRAVQKTPPSTLKTPAQGSTAVFLNIPHIWSSNLLTGLITMREYFYLLFTPWSNTYLAYLTHTLLPTV